MLLTYVANFPGQLHFRRSYFFKVSTSSEQLLQGKQLDTTVTFSKQLFLQSSYFFRSKLLPSCCFSRMHSSLGQLLFRSYFFHAGIFTPHQVFQNIFFSTKRLVQKRYLFRTDTFSEKQYSIVPIFIMRHLFIVGNFSRVTFSQQFIFQRSYNILFRKRYFFTVIFHFHSYNSYLSTDKFSNRLLNKFVTSYASEIVEVFLEYLLLLIVASQTQFM